MARRKTAGRHRRHRHAVKPAGAAPDRTGSSPRSFLPRLARAAAIGVALSYGGLLLWFGVTGRWIADGSGEPLVWDFLPVYVAGRLALRGQAAIAYDLDGLHRAQQAFIGHDFPGFLGWHYPPLFLIVAALLALLPYTAAFLA
jgi:hypothetical protein